MVLPTEPGIYEDRVGDLWILRDEDGKWQYAARRLPFGGITTRGVDARPIDAAKLAEVAPFPDSELLPLKRVQVEAFPPPA